MKTTLLVLAVLSLALVGCGKKDKKKGSNALAYQNFVSDYAMVVVLPQQSPTASQQAPIIESDGMRLNVSYSSCPNAKLAINSMYQNQGGFQLASQDASSRRFVAHVTGSCTIPCNQQGGFNQNYNGGYTQPGYTQPGYTQPGFNQPVIGQPGYGQPAYGNQYGANTGGCANGAQFIIHSIRPYSLFSDISS